MGLGSEHLRKELNNLIGTGHLEVIMPDGQRMEFGQIGDTPHVVVCIASRAWLRRIMVDPSFQLGEAYMFQGLTVERGSIFDFLDLIWMNLARQPGKPITFSHWLRNSARTALRRLYQWNDNRKSRSNIAHHYDIGNELYRLFLDGDMQYSCAYFPDPDTPLDKAQKYKRKHIARKLCLEPGQRVLDIGCGWGGLALHMAREDGVKVDGVTLSEEQIATARERAANSPHDSDIDFRLTDYREVSETYDRVVSVGMLEHVGYPQFQTYFDRVAANLKDDGLALIHTIGRPHGPGANNPWIEKRIFPGGYIPALSELLPAIEKAGLTVLDVEILRLHYAETLKAWRERFMANAERAAEMHDETFVRMWEFYLACSEASFRHGEHVVFQIQLGHKQTAAPLTRDYLYTGEKTARRGHLRRTG